MTKGKDEAAALVAVLQSASEPSDARCSACEAVLHLTRSDVACAVLCSVGGVHAVVNAVKGGAGEGAAFLKAAAGALSNLYRFDQKLVSVVVRLQARGTLPTARRRAAGLPPSHIRARQARRSRVGTPAVAPPAVAPPTTP